MNSNEAFEKFSQKFYKEYGYLPLGKSDVLRPNVEKVLGDLGATFCELLEAKESAKLEAPLEKDSTPNKTKVQIVELVSQLEDAVAESNLTESSKLVTKLKYSAQQL